MKRRQNFTLPDSRCVFCLRATGTTDEHIIPRSIGGGLIINRGTCLDCLKNIQAVYEREVLDVHYSSAQTLLGIPSRTNKKRRGFKGPKWAADLQSAKMEYIRPEEHSGFITTVNFERPGIEVGRPPQAGFGQGYTVNLTQIAPGADVPALSTLKHCDEWKVAAFVAKIAHGYWVAMEGHDSLHFLLQDLILRGDRSLAGFLIGKCNDVLPADDLHHIGHRVIQIGSASWGCVDLALFSCLNRPEFQARYRVYLGKLVKGPYILRKPFQTPGL